MSQTKLISIIGAGHSGSTLLDLILGCNSQIFSVGEICHWDRYIVENKMCSCGSPTHTCEFWNEIVSNWIKSSEKVNEEARLTNTGSGSFKGSLDSIRYRCCQILSLVFPMHKTPSVLTRLHPDIHTRVENITTLFEQIRIASDKPILCDSSKSVFRFRLLHARKPDSTKAIFLTRDGRAIAASNLKRTGANPVESARNWRSTNLYTHYMLKAIPSESYLHIRYEELCRYPEETLKKICKFIDCPFEDNMLNLNRSKPHNLGGNRMRMKGLYEIKEDLKWKDTLTSEQIVAFNNIAGKANSKFLGPYQVN